MIQIIAVGAGGFCGAVFRYLLSGTVQQHFSEKLHIGGFPLGTLLVNLLGAFFIGLLTELSKSHWPEQKTLTLFLTTGVLGGFTTFSTFSLEAVNLFQNGEILQGSLYAGISLLGCFLGVLLGKLLGKALS